MRIAVIMMALASTAVAELSWPQQTVEVKVHPTQVMTEAEFHFTNTGEEPVTISDVVVTCGCMSAKPSGKQIAPGEEGSLTIRINLKNRQGNLRKMAMVRTAGGQEHILTVVADIPKAYEITPPIIRWNKDDHESIKTAHLVNPNEEPIRLLSITSSDAQLPAVLKTIREGFEYEVVVSRSPDAEQARSVIRIITEPPPEFEESKTLKIYAIAP